MKRIKKEYYFIAVLLILFFIITMFVVKGTADIIDEAAFNELIKIKGSSTTLPLRIITHMASTSGIIILLFITAAIFIKRKCFSDFKYVIVNVGAGFVVMEAIKYIVQRARPAWKWIKQDGFAYPSGHTMIAMMFYGTLILLINKKLDKKYRKPLTILFSLMILLTPVSRVFFGAHYLSDVVASLLLGSIILIITNIVMNKEFNNDKNKDKKSI